MRRKKREEVIELPDADPEEEVFVIEQPEGIPVEIPELQPVELPQKESTYVPAKPQSTRIQY